MITEQVWIVDDDSSIRWVLEKAFANENISCAAFESAENLLIALDHGQPEVIISDIRMPNIDGMELIKEIKQTALPYSCDNYDGPLRFRQCC